MAARRLRITFVLPKIVRVPVGGFKVHYQYANALASRGHAVAVVHPSTAGAVPSSRELAAFCVARAQRLLLGRPPLSWFALDDAIRAIDVIRLTPAALPRADVTVLTAWQTAERTVDCGDATGRLLQIVYDYEHWKQDLASRPRIERALTRPDVTRIAGSGAVARLLAEIGGPAIATVTAGLQTDEFGVDEPLAARRRTVTFALRPGPSKDMATAFAAVAAIGRRAPDVEIRCFGHPRLRAPDGVRHLGRLSTGALRRCYNETAVFMSTSRYEGWGLPVLEAMACGAAAVSTRNGGTEDFVRDAENGLLVAIGDPGAVAGAVVRLLDDPDYRLALAARGAMDAASMTLERSVDRLEELLRDAADH